MPTTLQKQDELQALQQAEPLEAISIAQAFHAVLTKGISAEQIQAAKQLLAMDAERQFNIAFTALQKEMPVIVAESVIPNRGKYQKYEDIMDKNGVADLLAKHGFSVSFSNENKDGRIIETCFLAHIGGHCRANSFSVRVGGKADSETQADTKAATTAKRNALCQALNIRIRQDIMQDEDDPRNEGDCITLEQAFELERRVAETNSDAAAFLKLAEAASFKEIREGKYEMLDSKLRKKEAMGR